MCPINQNTTTIISAYLPTLIQQNKVIQHSLITNYIPKYLQAILTAFLSSLLSASSPAQRKCPHMGKFEVIDLLHRDADGILSSHSKSKQNNGLDNRFDRWGDNIIQNKVYKLNSDISDRAKRHSDVSFISNSYSGDSRSNREIQKPETSGRRRRSGDVFHYGSESSRGEHYSNGRTESFDEDNFRDISFSDGQSDSSYPRIRRDLEGFPSSKEDITPCSLNFKSLSVGCTSNEDKMEFISACPNAKDVVSSKSGNYRSSSK